MDDTKEEKEAWEGQRIEATQEEVKEVPKQEAPKGILCACGKPVGVDSPQIDQCLACFNRT